MHDAGVSTIVILCLALGIGVNATLFSVVDGVLIQSLPYAEPDRLLVLNESFERGGIRDAGVVVSGPAGLARSGPRLFAPMAAIERRAASRCPTGAEPERFAGRGDHLEHVPDPRRARRSSGAISAPTTIVPAPSRS